MLINGDYTDIVQYSKRWHRAFTTALLLRVLRGYTKSCVFHSDLTDSDTVIIALAKGFNRHVL